MSFVRETLSTGEWIEHSDGTGWWDAPLPRRLHRCKAQTRARIDGFVERCACGAIRLGGYGPWLERNQRRRTP